MTTPPLTHPAAFRWSSYRANALGQADTSLTPHPLYLGLDAETTKRLDVYRGLLRPQLDDATVNEVRIALKPGMPFRNERFANANCALLGISRYTGKRGRVRVRTRGKGETDAGWAAEIWILRSNKDAN